jgi:peptidyl-tRNA hydrolase
LVPGQILAQAVHAAFTFSLAHPYLTREWLIISNYICILEADNEEELNKLLERASREEIITSTFREPDYDNSLTAIAIEPGSKSKKLCSSYKLALK